MYADIIEELIVKYFDKWLEHMSQNKHFVRSQNNVYGDILKNSGFLSPSLPHGWQKKIPTTTKKNCL